MKEKSEIRNKFSNIIITDMLKTIRSVFQLNNSNSYNLNTSPHYQRNYVWSFVKATYFIESILIHGEIPPFVIFERGETWELIDGKQRAETIIRYLNDQFVLKAQGLEELWTLAGKAFSDLESNLKERILDTKLRFIIIKPRDEKGMDAHSEEFIKREIFKRHNLGITPLKKEEVFKAQYLQDEIDIYFRSQFKKNIKVYEQVLRIFDHRKQNIEKMMQHIRQMLVLHNIPINKFADEKDDTINRYYDYLSFNATKNNKNENILKIFKSFENKIFFLTDLKNELESRTIPASGLVYDSIFWALSVCEKSKVGSEKIKDPIFKERLIKHIEKHVDKYLLERSHQTKKVMERFGLIGDFFHSQLKISFSDYLHSNKVFLDAHKVLMQEYLNERFQPGLEKEKFSKVDPTSSTVEDILHLMKGGKFNLRPPYQRKEVMSRFKASSLIESMLLGIRLHPIYIFIRENGVREVIDGQQRLLSILAFLGHEFLNEEGQFEFSKKNKFSLSLEHGLLPYNNLKFEQLPNDIKKHLRNYTIQVIEIKEENNRSFVPEALFKRLNHKPYPIKENTFEYWNSYIDPDITSQIKTICKRNTWLYLRKTDVRMLNEELVTCLCYLHYISPGHIPHLENLKQILGIYRSRSGIVVRIKNKKYISYFLQDPSFKEEFLKACVNFEIDFLEKIKALISIQSGNSVQVVSNKRLDSILQTKGIRVGMSYLILWLILLGIPVNNIKVSRVSVLDKIRKLFILSKGRITAEIFEKAIIENWDSINKLQMVE